jgi:DNA processing protein
MTITDLQARIVWSLIAEPGDADAGRLIQQQGAVDALDALQNERLHEEFIDAHPRWMPRLTRLGIADLNPAIAHQEQQIGRFGVTAITPEHEHWPKGLLDLKDSAPHVLYVRGDTSVLASAVAISIVGARAATGYGEHVTIETVAGLVDHGFTIVSGAAFGIDGAAHRAALAAGGKTIAYLAGGVDRFWPAGHETLLQRIVDNGAVVSEVSLGTAPTKWRFLQRNRLIAAHSPATVVVEAGHRSGSLNTAGHAVTLGRALGAVPGPVTSSSSAGCHRLIREYDATCVTTAGEMAELVSTTNEGE